MLRQFQLFLGPVRLRLLILLLAFTGLGSVLLNAVGDGAAWAQNIQTALALAFIVGAVLIIGSKLDPYDRGRWAAVVVPAVLAVMIGILFVPNLTPLFLGGGIGWVFAGLFLFRARGPMEYQRAIKLMRKNDYAEAVKIMDALIKDEPDVANHYRLRAEILRLWGKLDRARRDYERMTKVDPDSAVAFNGLAEVLLQSGSYDRAHQAAEKAYALAPNEWVATYNLGMIEDRLGDAPSAIEHLNMALDARVPDARHRLLIHFYLARAHARMGDTKAASESIENLKKHRGGLNEWQVILQSDQAQTLRDVIADDINMAKALIEGELTVEALR